MADLIHRHAQPSSQLSVAHLCELVALPRRTYYRLAGHALSADVYMQLRDQIQRIALEWPSYGYRRVTRELARQGSVANHKLVLRLMRTDNLLCLRRRPFIRTTDSHHQLPVYPNLAQQMVLTGIDQLWVADITYVKLRHKFVYLAVILDAFSRRCIGWTLERHLQ